jgi:hypothetical protein
MKKCAFSKFAFLGMIIFVLTGCNGNSTSDVTSSGVAVTPSEPSSSASAPGASGELRSATLYWSAPFEKVNGEPLASDELIGFQIYYGVVDNPYENVISIDSPYITSYTIPDLPIGEYTFSIVAVDLAGRTSTFSNTIVKSIS